MKKSLFVFSGQSNMMRAATRPPTVKINCPHTLEYKHKPVILGQPFGKLVPVSYHCGEFIYKDPTAAYKNTDENGNSLLSADAKNTLFVPPLCNRSNTESNVKNSPCFPVYFANEWEKLGASLLFAHIAQGGVRLNYYFNRAMLQEFHEKTATAGITEHLQLSSAEEYDGEGSFNAFAEKCIVFFKTAEKQFGAQELGEKVFVWHQGESDSDNSTAEYKLKLEILWNALKKLGFTKFFMLRVGFFGDWSEQTAPNVMRAQEQFCQEQDDAFMLTRDFSFMPDTWMNEDVLKRCYISCPPEQYFGCRDTYFEDNNMHLNENAFALAAKTAAKNAYGILFEEKQPDLPVELVRALL